MPKGVYVRSEEYKLKMRILRKGICFNTGRTRIKKGQRISVSTEFKKGQESWLKGKNNLNVPKGNLSHKWKGGRWVNKNGYVSIYKPDHPNCKNNYVLEHRLVVEAQIGRYLESHEEVHHLGNKDDNRPEMLMAFINESSHRRFECGAQVKQEEIIFDGR